MTQIITSRGGGGGGGGGADMLKCVYDPNNCNADAFDYCNFSNTPDLSCYQTKACMVCDLTGADNNHYPSALAVANAITCSGGGDVSGPSCSTDGNVVLFDGATGKCIKDSGVSLSCKQDKLTAGANIDMTCAKVSATNTYIVTEAITCTTYTGEKGVAPYNTSYCYTNICIDPASGIKWQEGSIYTFDIDTEMLATSACRNVRVKIGDGDYIPVMGTSSILAGNSYFTKTNIRQYQYSTKYQACGALHLFTDSNTTYSAMSNTEATTGTCTSGRSIAACTLKCAIQTHAPISTTAYGSGWCGSNSAPTQNAVYAKVSTIDAVIPSAATCSNQLADKNYVNDSINSVTAYYITKNAAGDQFATHSELVNAGTYYSGGAVRVPTRNDYAIVLDDETHNDEVTRYIYNNGWEYQYTINESPLTQAQLNALNSGITAAKVSCYDAIPVITDNCQIANGCGYTTCTGTISTCAQIISTLGYTPYNSTNPNGYTTCTGTLTASNISDTAFGSSWDGDTTTAPSKNAVYDVLGDVETLLANL